MRFLIIISKASVKRYFFDTIESFGKEVLFRYHRVTIASKFKIENIFIEKLNVFDLFSRSSSEKITSY